MGLCRSQRMVWGACPLSPTPAVQVPMYGMVRLSAVPWHTGSAGPSVHG